MTTGTDVPPAPDGRPLPADVAQRAVAGLGGERNLHVTTARPGHHDAPRQHQAAAVTSACGRHRCPRTGQGPKEWRSMMGTDIRVRRVYDDPSPDDGARVLVDRVWPRGMRKDAARLDEWAKDVAPSAKLRTWYRHDPVKFGEFRRRYTAELAEPAGREALARLRALADDRPVTLLTATRDLDLSQAAVLAELLRDTK